MSKISIKKGDSVKVLSGKEKGKSGKVLEVIPKANRLTIEGLNIRVRFSKPKRAGEKGQRMELPASMHISNVMLVCPHCGNPTRVGREVTDNGILRKCKSCGKNI
ncbi:MAG: 50S ribosomal protein L24 [Candidatus Doudnabacteria bacterium]|nr:50S ribosomal protein L24 [Candidatus Doudnabacteria bacterium]